MCCPLYYISGNIKSVGYDMKVAERDFLLGKIAGDQESIFRELTEIKKNDLKDIKDKLNTLNGSVAENSKRSIKSEAYWEVAKLAAKIGVPITAGAFITNYYGIW